MGQAQEMLSHDLAAAERAINTLVTQAVTQAQVDALASFVFNLGVGALGRSTLLKRVNRGDMTGAAAEFGKWVLADGKPMPGLVRRRKAEAVLFRMGNYDVAMRIIRTGV
jgi:lysozyme